MWIIKYVFPKGKFHPLDDEKEALTVKDENGNDLIFDSIQEAYEKAHVLQCIENEKPMEEKRNIFFPVQRSD